MLEEVAYTAPQPAGPKHGTLEGHSRLIGEDTRHESLVFFHHCILRAYLSVQSIVGVP